MQQNALLRPRWARLWPVLAVMGGAIALDQVTKAIVRAKLDFGELWPGDWPVRITRVNNTGSAFGLFDGQTLFLIIASILAIGFMIYFYRQMAGAGWLLRLSMGLQLGGAASNLADRIRDGEVTDFIEFPHWPVFNAADSSVVIGILLLAWCVLFMERGHAKT